ncbi:MAG: alpha/beta hydrolase family protein [Parahaliea sp.]
MGQYDITDATRWAIEPSYADPGRAYLAGALGKDEQTLAEFPPVANADKIKAPVFLAHGGEDKRTPIECARALEAALCKAGVPVVTRYYARVGAVTTPRRPI